MSLEKGGSIFNTSEFDVSELDIYICDLKNVLDTENITEVISQGKELLDSLSWIRRLVDHYKELKTMLDDIVIKVTEANRELDKVQECMNKFETVANYDSHNNSVRSKATQDKSVINSKISEWLECETR